MIDLKNINTRSVSIVASRMVSDKLAKVMISCAGNCTPDFIAAEVSKELGGMGSVVESSFKRADVEGRNNLAVGFVRVNREVRVPTTNELKANYRKLSDNVMMSLADSTLWDVKKNGEAKYLTRRGQEDLSELLDLCTAKCAVNSTERMALAASVRPEKYDFISFVNALGDTDYGFVLASNEAKTKVVSYARKASMVIPTSAVIFSVECAIDPVLAKTVRRKLEADTKDGSLSDMEQYYKTLFSFDEKYMQDFIDEIKQLERTIA